MVKIAVVHGDISKHTGEVYDENSRPKQEDVEAWITLIEQWLTDKFSTITGTTKDLLTTLICAYHFAPAYKKNLLNKGADGATSGDQSAFQFGQNALKSIYANKFIMGWLKKDVFGGAYINKQVGC